MSSKSLRKQRREIRQCVSEFSAVPWAMEENALANMLNEAHELGDRGLRDANLEFYSRTDFEPGANVLQRLEERAAKDVRERLLSFASVSAADDGSDEYSVRSLLSGRVLYVLVAGAIHSKGNFFTRYFGDTSVADVRRDVVQARGDDRVDRVVMVFDSPGGSVFGLAETAEEIYQTRGKKPIAGFVDGLCASAAYFLGSACERLTATASCSIGSIGVIAVAASVLKLYEREGIDVKAITFGKNKGVGSPFKALDDNAVKVLQESVDEYGNQFVAAVAKHRDVSSEKVMSDFGQGKVFIAEKARAIGLIDAVEGAGSSGVVGNSDFGIRNSEKEMKGEGSHDSESRVAKENVVTSSAGAGSARASSFLGVDCMSITLKIRSALFALGWIDSTDASDEVCTSVLNAIARASGQNVPSEEQAVLDMIVRS